LGEQKGIGKERSFMAKTIATILGIIFIAVGLLGFASPNVMGMHLSMAHNIVHLVSGVVALYVGLQGSFDAARTFCIIFGVVYGLLGAAGFVFGGAADHMLTVVPDQLVLGTMDHIVHIVLGAIFLIAGLVRHHAPLAPPAAP